MAMVEGGGRGFFMLDEPFAHLSIDRIDDVGRFLRASGAQFVITAPTTLDRAQLDPASLVVMLRKKKADSRMRHPRGGGGLMEPAHVCRYRDHIVWSPWLQPGRNPGEDGAAHPDLQGCGREQAVRRPRVPIFRDQEAVASEELPAPG